MDTSPTPPPAPATPSTEVPSHKLIWIGGVVFALLIVTVVVSIVLGKFGSTPSSTTMAGTLVAGGNNCPAVTSVALSDFQNPTQAPWVKAQPPTGFSSTILVPQGSRDTTGLASDTIVGFPQIAQNPAIKDPASLKLLYQGNLDMYAVDRYNVYFIYLPSVTAWKGEQLVMTIPNADINSFTALQAGDSNGSYTGFAMDKNHVYFLGDVVPDVSPSSFKLLNYHYALTTDASGGLVFLSAPENSTRADGSVPLSRRTLTPLEALYIKTVTNASQGTTTPLIAFSQLKDPIPTDGAEIRTIVDSGTYSVRRYLPSIYGVFKSGAQDPSVCFAAEDFLIRNSVMYKSHALLQLLQSAKPVLADVDFSPPNINVSVLPFALDYYSQIIFDDTNKALWVLKTDGGDATQRGYALTKLSFDDVITNNVSNGKVLLQEKGADLAGLVLSNDGTVAAALHGSDEYAYDLIIVDLNSGSTQKVAVAGRGKDTFSPLFFSADDKKLFYFLSPYEAFDEPSPFMYRHDLSAPASSFGTESELTPIRTGDYISSEDGKTLYYLYETKPLTACNGVDGYYNNALASYDTVVGTNKNLFTASGNTVLGKVKLDPSGNQLSVEIHSQVASTTDSGASCIDRMGDLVETKTISL
jgi:hypothetical protein